MGRKPVDVVTTTVWLTARERLILDEMRGMVGINSDANLMRCALWFYAKHLEIGGLHYSDFGLRERGQHGHVRNPESRKVCGQRAKAAKETRASKASQPDIGRSGPDHPWRRGSLSAMFQP